MPVKVHYPSGHRDATIYTVRTLCGRQIDRHPLDPKGGKSHSVSSQNVSRDWSKVTCKRCILTRALWNYSRVHLCRSARDDEARCGVAGDNRQTTTNELLVTCKACRELIERERKKK